MRAKCKPSSFFIFRSHRMTTTMMMRLSFAVFILIATLVVSLADKGRPVVALNVNSIAADSKFGMKLLSQARRLEEEAGENQQGDEEGENNEEDNKDEEEEGEEEEDNVNEEEENNNEENAYNDDNNGKDITWVAGYSLKFQGCHHIRQYNADAQDENDVRIETKRLVRFRLCPTSSCSATKAAGCSSGYGDYIIDLKTYLAAYYEAKKEMEESKCENHLQNTCNCDDDGSQGDNFDANQCEYDCFYNAGMYYCIDNDDGGNGFDPEDYTECAGLYVNARERRKLDEAVEEVQYYVGPYCAKQGGQVYMGMFSDDTCTELASASFKSVMGYDLPYESESIVDATCMSCAELADGNNADDDADADATSETCEYLYAYSGKCETNLPSETVSEQSNNACNYMTGIKIARADGSVVGKKRPNATVTAFIVIFAVLFAAMLFYVWYLRTRLGVKKTAFL